jgi:hypothetical protein
MAIFQLTPPPEYVKSMLRKAAITQLPDGYDVTRTRPVLQPVGPAHAWYPTVTCSPRSARAARQCDRPHRHVHRIGIKLASGVELAADIVVSATGLSSPSAA